MSDSWLGVCEWCGEDETELSVNADLPEWTEGVACRECTKFMLDEIDHKNNIEHEQELDRMEFNYE